MAAVKVEGDVTGEARFNQLRDAMGFDRKGTLGFLTALWQESQTKKFIKGAEEQLLAFLDVPMHEKSRALDSLILAGYVTDHRDGTFEVKGNGARIGPKPKAAKGPSSSPTWDAYSRAYFDRYHTYPVRNAKVNGMLASLVGRVGAEVAPAVAEFFVKHEEKLYVTRLHPVDLLLRDAEALHTQWKTQRSMTSARATDRERQVHNAESFMSAVAGMRAVPG